MTSCDDIAAILRDSTPATGDELRHALAQMRAEGLVLIDRDELRRLRLAALGNLADADRPKLRHLATFGLLNDDTDLLAEALVDLQWEERRAAA